MTKELAQIKQDYQPKIRPLLNWNRQLQEQVVALPEQYQKLQAENMKVEKSFVAAPAAAGKAGATSAKAPAPAKAPAKGAPV